MIVVIHVQNEIILYCKKIMFRAEKNVSSLCNSTYGLVHMESNHCLLCKKYSPWTAYDINGPPPYPLNITSSMTVPIELY